MADRDRTQVSCMQSKYPPSLLSVQLTDEIIMNSCMYLLSQRFPHYQREQRQIWLRSLHEVTKARTNNQISGEKLLWRLKCILSMPWQLMFLKLFMSFWNFSSHSSCDMQEGSLKIDFKLLNGHLYPFLILYTFFLFTGGLGIFKTKINAVF